MARFKLVKIGKKGKRRVEVQKVRFKLHFGALLLALVCAMLVWLYVKGSTPPKPEYPEGFPPEAFSSETEAPAEEATVDTGDEGV